MNNTDICNLALSYLGKGPIDSIDDTDTNAVTCKIHYDHKRQMLLKDYPWGFAERTEKLAELDSTLTTEVQGWNHVYSYPDKCLSIKRVFTKDEASERLDTVTPNKYKVALLNDNIKVICTNVERAYCDYTYDEQTANIFPPEFCDALAHFLASAMSQALCGSAKFMNTEYQLGQVLARKATYNAGMEQEKKPGLPEKYFDARF